MSYILQLHHTVLLLWMFFKTCFVDTNTVSCSAFLLSPISAPVDNAGNVVNIVECVFCIHRLSGSYFTANLVIDFYSTVLDEFAYLLG